VTRAQQYGLKSRLRPEARAPRSSHRDAPMVMYVIIAWLSVQYLLTGLFPVLPDAAVWLDDGLLVVLTVIWIARKLATSAPFRPQRLDMCLLAFLLVGVVSATVNHVDLRTAVPGIRALVGPILLYYAVTQLRFSRRTLRRMIYLVLWMAVLQLPFVIYSARQTGVWWGDYVTGMFDAGSGGGLGHFLSLSLLLLVGLLRYDRHRMRHLLMAGAILGPLVLTSSRLSYLVIPLTLIWVYRGELVRRLSTVVLVAVVIAVLGAAIVYSYQAFSSFSLSDNLNPTVILQDQFNPTYSGRLVWYSIAWEQLKTDAVNILIGFGPGTFSSFTAERNQTPIFQTFEWIRRSQGFALMPQSEFISVPGEYGVIGLLAYSGILVAAYRSVSKRLKHQQDPFWKGVGYGAKAMIIYFAVAGLTQNTWETAFVAGYFWLVLGTFNAATRPEAPAAKPASVVALSGKEGAC
jgi:O-Antigen ligase